MEIEVVILSFENTNQLSFCVANRSYEVNQKVLVNTEEGLKVAKIKKANHKVEEQVCTEQLSINRVLTREDEQRIEENKEKAKNLRIETEKLIEKLKLDMKLVEVTVSFDGSKALFLYVSEDRVDFRELVKLMASNFKVRIELKQIGVRDEVKTLGGLGPCGRICCCKGHLTEFANVSIKMAKTQNLSLNPQKISGLCGRLMCCLSYENELYKELLKDMPKINSKVKTELGEGTVSYLDIFKRKVSVKFVDENSVSIKDFALDEIKKHNKYLGHSENGEHSKLNQQANQPKNNPNGETNND